MKDDKSRRPQRWYSPSQAQRDLKCIDQMFETEDAGVMTAEIRDKLKMAILRRLARSVEKEE